VPSLLANVACVTPNENSRLGILICVVGSATTVNHSGSSKDRAGGCKMRSSFRHARFPQSLDPEDLARVHYVVRIDSLLNCAHDAHRLAVLGEQEIDLAAADAVLAGTGAIER
jgi:hypothetical protein